MRLMGTVAVAMISTLKGLQWTWLATDSKCIFYIWVKKINCKCVFCVLLTKFHNMRLTRYLG